MESYDVCIVGSGPAGGTIANELAGSGLKVCVLESGGRKTTEFGDSLREVESHGIVVKPHSRERIFGGTSTTWAGLSGLLDEIDFMEREWVKYSGWPIERDELMPYYIQAADRFRFPKKEMFEPKHWSKVKSEGSFEVVWKTLEQKVFLAAAEPQNYSTEFTSVYQRDDTNLILDASVISIEGDATSGRATFVKVARSDKTIFRLKARCFILAANGIENTRLLLSSRFSCEQGLGNEEDQVGRYFMNHIKGYHGVIKVKRPIKELPAYFGFLSNGFAGYIGHRINEKTQRDKKLLNSYIRFEPIFGWSDNRGVESAIFFIKRLSFVMKSFRRLHGRKTIMLRDYAETGDDSELQNERKNVLQYMGMVGAIIINFFSVLKYAYFRAFNKSSPKIHAIRIRNFMEMEPVPENRILLGEEKDVLGNRLPVVKHRATALDQRTMVALHEYLSDEISREGWGELISDIQERGKHWPINGDASHHMGSTRMGTNPKHSVLDRNCRVHSCPNVYIAGASTFPTGGNVNPTFTVVALSIRLADYLKKSLKKDEK